MTHDRRVTIALCLLALAAAGWSMIGARWLEPHLSINADEHAYVEQARLLAQGKLVVGTPSGAAAKSFQPWFAIATDHGYVFKYNPVWPGVLAVGDLVGFLELGLGIAAAAFVFGMFFLARQLLDSRDKALVATALVMLAPVTVLQFSSYLSYVWFGAVWTFSAGLLVQGVRNRALPSVAGAGVLASVAFASRPYDAALVLIPFIAWTLWTLRRDPPFLLRATGAAAAAALPVVVLQLLYNHHVTGSFTTFPFSKWAPIDTLGYGPRGLDPSGHIDVDFTVGRGIEGSAAHLFQFGTWSFGGVVLAAVAVVGLLALRRHPRTWAAAGVIVMLPIGYAYFWGGYQIARLGEFLVRFGPYYFLPILVPVGIFAAEGLWQLWSRRRRLTVAALTAMVGFAAFGGTRAFGVVFDERAAREQPYALLARRFDRPGTHALVFLPERYLGLTLPGLSTRDLSRASPVLYAATGADLETFEAFPRRHPYRLVGCDYSYRGPLGTRLLPSDSTRLFPLVTGAGSRIQPLHVIHTTELHYRMTIAADAAPDANVWVDAGSHVVRAQVVAPSTGDPATVDIVVQADHITVTGSIGRVEDFPGTNDGRLLIGLTRTRTDGHVPVESDPDYWWGAPMRVEHTRLTLLGPLVFTTTETALGIPFQIEQCHALPAVRLTPVA